jgi:hypothetical protein
MADATTCPDCSGVLAYREGCLICLGCGYSICTGGERRL